MNKIKYNGSRRKVIRTLTTLAWVIALLWPGITPVAHAADPVSFAVIGDYGDGSSAEASVAALIDSWNVDFVVTTGDNRYGGATYDQVVGQFYCGFLKDAGSGGNCAGGTATSNAFFPSPGNHDYTDGAGINEYLNYFTLPGNAIPTSGTSASERYYDYIMGPVHFFVVDSQGARGSGSDMTAQQNWLQAQLAASTSAWKIVYLHHPPYSSSSVHGSTPNMQWPYAAWGADAVFAGHDHTYERLEVDGIAYFVSGLGGRSIYGLGSPIAGSQVRYNSNYGAMRVSASDTQITFEFLPIGGGAAIDSFTLGQVSGSPIVDISQPASGANPASGATIDFSATATDAEDGDVSASLVWSSSTQGQIGTGGSFSTVLNDGNHTITATATDVDNKTGSDSVTITVGAPPAVHTGDLDASSGPAAKGGRWNATVTMAVHDANDGVVSGALIEGSWSNGASGSASCTTDGSGRCSVTKNNLKDRVASVDFGVSDIVSSVGPYNAVNNHDPDGDSNGSTITVSKPGVNAAPATSISSPADGTIVSSGATITFAGTAIDAEDGDISAGLVWTSSIVGQIGTGAGFSAVLGDGNHTITASAIDSAGASGSDSVTLVVGSAPAMHVGDLDAATSSAKGGKWNADVLITLHDDGENPIVGATVSGAWSAGASGSGVCTTSGAGACTISKNNISRRSGSATFSVSGVSSGAYVYAAGSNHDPDGDSTGTEITVVKP